MSSLAELRELADRVSRTEQRLDVLVNNAGVMPDERTESPDGHELMFATHVLAPFALSQLLADLLERSAPARVINVSSGGMYAQRLRSDDLESERTSYGPTKIYARTKRQEVVLTELCADRLRDRGIVVHSMHPGGSGTGSPRSVSSPARSSAVPSRARTRSCGSAAPMRRSRAPGRFWHDRRPRPTHYRLGASEESAEERGALWDYCCSVFDASA